MNTVARFLLLLFLSLPGSGFAADSFSLDQVATIFPSTGLEAKVEFWTAIFSRYGDREVLLHDQDDVRLIYERVVFPRGVRNDRVEYRRQRDQLEKKQTQLRRRLDEIGRYGKNSERLTDEHHKIVRLLRTHGYEPTGKALKQLRGNIRSQRGIRERFLEGLIRSGRYIDQMQDILEQQDVPAELAYLPHVESSFDYRAYSKRGAAGIWQFMRGTGRLYMTVSSRVDERLDPIRASEGAARLLQQNYQALGTWPLAITAFNHGRNGMLRAKKEHGDDINLIIERYRSRTFGFASKNFYAEFLAALLVAKNYRTYFGAVELDPPFRPDSVTLEAAYHLSHVLDGTDLTEEVLRAHNGHIREPIWNHSKVLPAGITLRVPAGLGQPLREALASAPRAGGEVVTTADGRLAYRVQEGDSLSLVAARLGTSMHSLQRINDIRNPNRIYPGQLILNSETPQQATRYRVKRGDTLARIASRFGTSVGHLQQANQIDDPHRIYLGQLILVPR